MGKRAWFELGLGVAGTVYLVRVFFQNISSPLLALLVVMLAAYQLAGSIARETSLDFPYY
jgi:hypothetical protein